MAKLRTFKSIENDLYVLIFNVDSVIGEDDKLRMRKFGEPEINLGGGFIGGATATASLSGSSVTAIDVVDGGNSFTSAPTVTITGGGGSGATATAVVTNGKVSSITVTAGGTGYTSVPTVTIVNPTDYFLLPDELVKIRSGFPVRREFDSTASPFNTNTLVKVDAYKTEIQTRWKNAITDLRNLVDSFTGEDITEI